MMGEETKQNFYLGLLNLTKVLEATYDEIARQERQLLANIGTYVSDDDRPAYTPVDGTSFLELVKRATHVADLMLVDLRSQTPTLISTGLLEIRPEPASTSDQSSSKGQRIEAQASSKEVVNVFERLRHLIETLDQVASIAEWHDRDVTRLILGSSDEDKKCSELTPGIENNVGSYLTYASISVGRVQRSLESRAFALYTLTDPKNESAK